MYIVTGAAGFIGSHLSERLVEKGHEVVGIDCLTDYYDVEIKRRNIQKAAESGNFTFLEKNVLDVDFSGFEADAVFHLAAQPGVRKSWGKYFAHYVDSNVRATQQLLESLKNSGTKIVFASSSSVYGNADTPMKEEYTPQPVSPYGVTKLAAENLCYLYSKNYGMSVASLRYFTVYGPRQRPDMAFNKFINAVLNDGKIEIYGDGSQTRDFTFVDDVADATIKASDLEDGWAILNVGGGSIHSVNEVVEKIANITGKKVNAKHVENQKGDVRDTLADNALTREKLEWKPKTNLDTGLERQVKWQMSL